MASSFSVSVLSVSGAGLAVGTVMLSSTLLVLPLTRDLCSFAGLPMPDGVEAADEDEDDLSVVDPRLPLRLVDVAECGRRAEG